MTIELLGVDHIGIAVQDLDEATDRYRRLLGVDPSHRERVDDQGVEEVLFPVGESFVQLLGSLGPETPIGRHLRKRGPGVHHVAYRVTDVSRALEHLLAEGATAIDSSPRPGSRDTLVAFVHPRAMEGVLVELVQTR